MVLLKLFFLLFSLAAADISQSQVTSSPSLTPRLHVVAFASKHDIRSSYAQVSTEAHNLSLQLIGLGMNTWWPDGLGTKINAYRQFVLRHAADEDLVLMVDAFDVLLFGGLLEIVAGFEEIEFQHHRSIVFNAESKCFPRNCTEQPLSLEPRALTARGGERRFLNSGIIIGRGRALRHMMKDKVPDVIKGSDQAWFHSYFSDHPEQIFLDTNCRLICLIDGELESNHLEVTPNGRIRHIVTGSQPSVAHLVGPTHWPAWRRGGPSSILHELFHKLYPTEEQRIFGTWGLVLSLGPEIRITFFNNKEALRMLMKLGLCIQCSLLPEALGSGHNICKEFVSLFDEKCSTAGCIVVMLFVPILILILLWLRRFTLWPSHGSNLVLPIASLHGKAH